MNISFGACESSAGAAGVAFWDSLFQQAAAEGISVFVSSGDAGASGCDTAFATPPPSPAGNSPNYICSSSYATCVGGTEFNDTANPSEYWDANNGYNTLQSALSYIPEGAWNEPQGSSGTQAASSGGGVSAYIPTPAWQTGFGVPVARTGRYTPDVSFSASCHDAYFACFAAAGGSCVDDATGRFQFTSFCGTSASAPAMAGVAALLDDAVGAPQGNLNPQIYQVAANQASSSLRNSFHDITVAASGVAACDVNTPSMCNNSIPGPNGLSGGQPGYMLTDGYDEVTGLGSLDISSFLSNYHPAPTIKILRTPPALTFDTRIVGASETLQLDVVNTGASNMDALAITFSGPNGGDFAQTNNCPSQLGWEISCTIQVTFTPSAAGTRTATMTVASDNAVNSPKQVSLTGTGTTTLETPSVVVFPDSYITTVQPDHVIVNVYPQSGYPNLPAPSP